MDIMYNTLGNADVDHNVKPQIIAAMGDAALALGTDFETVRVCDFNMTILHKIVYKRPLVFSPGNFFEI